MISQGARRQSDDTLQAETGLAFLFVSHDIAVVERISHRIAVMYLGEIAEIGPRAAIIGSPQHPYAPKLMAAAPTVDPARRGFRLGVSNEEPPSPIRAVDYRYAPQRFRQVEPGHLAQEIC